MTQLERFEEKIERVPFTTCWLWSGALKRTSKWQYGHFAMRSGDIIGAHRAAWILYNGDIPHGAYVCHRCDEPSCVNPAHLYLGTPLSNMQDMRERGRDRNGHIERARKTSRITDAQVLEIRASALSFGKLAKQYGVSRSTIQFIKQRRTRRYL